MHQRTCRLLCILLILGNVFISIASAAAAPAEKPTPPATQGKAVILMDAHSGRVLYENNAHQRMSPASITKIMTALLVVENGNLNRVVEISKNAASTPESSVWLEEGEKIAVNHLLYALMLNSANDAAVALVEGVAGSVEAFVELMNRRARELGMNNTHFCNPHGLEETGHYTTAYDLALLSREAMTYEVFSRIVATKTYKIPWANNDYQRLLINKNRLLWRYDGAVGIKTGYTKQAGNCVVGAAQKGPLMLIAISLNSPNVYPDLQALFDYGFTNYHLLTLKEANQLSVEVPVLNGQEETVAAFPKTDLKVAVTDAEKAQTSYTVEIDDKITAPVREGQVVGICRIHVGEEEAGTVELVAGTSVAEKPPLWERFLSFALKAAVFLLVAFVVLFCILYLIRIINLRRRKRRMRRK
ncbi:MAG: D-alanyl-D-alanine carboxypeptidase [Syntrophomonadaceae bacterium]|nr:D-alanyl-D-alanine carboxypeptidase [Syntrophomonadaceae bacterium]